MCISFNHTQDFQWNVFTSKAQLVEKDKVFRRLGNFHRGFFFLNNSNIYVHIW